MKISLRLATALLFAMTAYGCGGADGTSEPSTTTNLASNELTDDGGAIVATTDDGDGGRSRGSDMDGGCASGDDKPRHD